MRRKFDIALEEGEIGEGLVDCLVRRGSGVKLEVKNDIEVSDTGNVFIEFEYNGEPSCLAITEAAWWAIALDGSEYEREVLIWIEIERLKKICRAVWKQREKRGLRGWVWGGDNNASKGVLVPLKALLAASSKIYPGKLI